MMNEKPNTLVVGVSSRALFNLEKGNAIFENEGIEKYREYQLKNEDKELEPGSAFPLVQSLLSLNEFTESPIIEVVVMSRNSPETGVRMLNSIEKQGLDIERIALSGGEPLAPYIKAYGIDLFLSRDESDVQAIIDSGSCAAASIYAPPSSFNPKDKRVKIAFDADAVLFSEESEYRYKTEGLDAFQKHESENVGNPLKEGPFAQLLIKLSNI